MNKHQIPKTSFLFCLWCLLFQGLYGQEQISGIVNDYFVVRTIFPCNSSLVVDNGETLSPGHQVLVYQAKGALISTLNDENFGQIEQIGGAGQYELNEVDAVIGDTVFLRFQFINTFDVEGNVQLIKVATYPHAVIQDTLKAMPWSGGKGGVIALRIENSLTLNAPIDASGMGFRGGNAQINDENDCAFFRFDNDYRYSENNWRGARKGEGIAKFTDGAEAGRGPQANGGGGGNDHNSGGGGGGHWCAGGDGGQNLITDPFGCGGRWPGIGGNALEAFMNERIFFGGGGGAGHGNNDVASDGGDGGGIVLIITNKLQSNGYSINAAGAHAENTTGDGAGGGGGGGTIVLYAAEVVDTLVMDVNGGNGGTVENRNQARCMGPGGRGASGQLRLGFQNVPADLDIKANAGEAGISLNSTICAITENQGNQPICQARDPSTFLKETSLTDFELNIADEELESITLDSIDDVWLCENTSDTIRVTFQGSPVTLDWTVDNGQEKLLLTAQQTITGPGFTAVIVPEDGVDRTGWTYLLKIMDGCDRILSTSFSIVGVDQPPMGSITQAVADSTVAFKFEGINVEDYQWDFGDGNTSNLPDPVHAYNEGGTYEVTLIGANRCGSQIFLDTIAIGQAPVATYKVVGMTEGCVPLEVTYRGSAGDQTYNWRFPGGDPTISTEVNPTILYEEPGNFGLELIVGNGFGWDTLEANEVINVFAVPVAKFEYTIDGQQVFFKNQSQHATRFLWEFGDGQNSDLEEPIHEYELGGTFQVTLNAINDGCGATITTNLSITVTSNKDKVKVPLLAIYPNPAIRSLNLDWSGDLKDVQVRIYNTIGQVMVNEKLERRSSSWEVNNWSSGVYWVMVDHKRHVMVQKVVIQHQ